MKETFSRPIISTILVDVIIMYFYPAFRYDNTNAIVKCYRYLRRTSKGHHLGTIRLDENKNLSREEPVAFCRLRTGVCK